MSGVQQIPGWEEAIGRSSEQPATAAVEVVDGPAGWTIRWVDRTGSTNSDLLDAVRLGAPDRTVLVTGHQTAGRGRLDRRWDAPPGANLLVSVLFRDDVELRDDPGLVSRRIALAAVTAAERFVASQVALKWPNDVLLDGHKVGGILAQRAGTGDIVVGLGLNIGWAPDGAARLGDGIDPLDVLLELLDAYDALVEDVPVDGLGAIYRSRLDTVGRQVRVILPDGELTGRALDVSDDGRLLVLDECGLTHRLDVGDVVHVRPAADEA